MPSGYLDHNLIVALGKRDESPENMNAAYELLRRRKRGQVSLETSHISKEEFDKHALGAPPEQEAIYNLLDDVPPAPEEFLFPLVQTNLTSGSRLVGPSAVRDEVLGRLEAILPDRDDARHVFQAAHAGYDYFVTFDRRTILRFANEIEAAANIKAVSPTELLKLLDAQT
jgi:hypothetical protein